MDMKRLILFPLLCLGAPAVAQQTEEADLARATLSALQAKSFANNREYCGYIVLDAAGNLAATPATEGAESECLPDEVPEHLVPIASYHTHGAFAYDVPAEFPSVSDIEADEDEGVDGYMTSPGGRFWYIDSTDMIVSQICGIGCVPQDPNFEAGLDGDIAISYTYEELLELEAE